MSDPFGNYLCQKLVENCTPEELHTIIEKIIKNFINICMNQHGTRAVQKIIEIVKKEESISKIIEALKESVLHLVKVHFSF